MRGIKYPTNLRDNLIDNEIVPKLLLGEIMADLFPVAANPPPPHAQSEPEPTSMGEVAQGYTEPFIPLFSPEQREQLEAQVEAQAQSVV